MHGDYIFIWLKLVICSSVDCRSKLKEHMQYCVDHPEEISKLAKVKAQVSEVKGVMMENIEKVDSLDLSVLLTCFVSDCLIILGYNIIDSNSNCWSFTHLFIS